MSRRLVIPADAKVSDIAFPDREDKMTWKQVQVENDCEAIEKLGSKWCVENGIDGLGVCTEDSGQVVDSGNDQT